MGHDAAFRAAIAEEWKASFTDWEYALALVGKTPQSARFGGEQGRRGTFYEGYKTKVMRPHGK